MTESLPAPMTARHAELTPGEIARDFHAHPTLSGAAKETAHRLMEHKIKL